MLCFRINQELCGTFLALFSFGYILDRYSNSRRLQQVWWCLAKLKWRIFLLTNVALPIPFFGETAVVYFFVCANIFLELVLVMTFSLLVLKYNFVLIIWLPIEASIKLNLRGFQGISSNTGLSGETNTIIISEFKHFSKLTERLKFFF